MHCFNAHFDDVRGRVLSLVMQELLQTEKDYIRALNYVVDNYIPEILLETVPQPLRGKKNVVFGNLQNICKFHTEAFLREIEACMESPYQLGACFLRHVSVSPMLLLLLFRRCVVLSFFISPLSHLLVNKYIRPRYTPTEM